MKKLLLSGAFLLALSFGAKAQSESLTFSFEEEEGFTIGEIGEQSDFWGTFSDTDPFYVTDEFASDGTQALKFGPPVSQDYTGGYLYFSNPYTQYNISQDLLTDQVSSTASSFQIVAGYYDSGSFTTASMLYFYYGSGSVYVFYGEGDTDFELLGTYDAEQWFNLKTSYDADNGEITYYINDEEIYSSAFYSGEGVSVNMIQYIAEDGDSNWYMDNVVVSDNSAAAVATNTLNALSVYPNPASDVINVANTNALVQNVSLTDINGRVVKTVSFDGVTDAQVNIADLASGVYVMSVTSDKGTSTKKIVKN